MNDIGLLPILNRIAEAAMSAHRRKRGATDIQRHIVEAVTPLAEELVLIGVDRALIAVYDCAKELRRSVRKAKGQAEHAVGFAMTPDP